MKDNRKDFYNKFHKKLLRDYLLANPRIEQAISTVISKVGLENLDVLDVGCGLGWSSSEFSKIAANVKAIDLSDNLIEIANEMFQNTNLEYRQSDVTQVGLNYEKKFDLVTMLDVFEHIQASKRLIFIEDINNVLKPGGLVFFSCPSIYHQKFLREHRPEGLQPVDEDIDIEILNDVAKKLDNGDVMYFSYISIWQPNDYFYAILQKSPINFEVKNHDVSIEKLSERFNRVKTWNKDSNCFSGEEIKLLNSEQKRIKKEQLKSKIKKVINK